MQAYRRNKLGMDARVDDYNDPDCYKVELSKNEYLGLLQKIESLGQKNIRQKQECDDQLRYRQEQADAELAEANDRIAELEEKIANDSEFKKLIMQMKNDSCTDRDVSRKRSGYFFIDGVEWREKTAGWSKKIFTWKYVIQTPVPASFPRKIIEASVWDMISQRILPDCGCVHIVEDNQRADIEKITSHGSLMEKYLQEPYVYDWKMRANFGRGYWDVELFITRELEIPAGYQLYHCRKTHNRV